MSFAGIDKLYTSVNYKPSVLEDFWFPADSMVAKWEVLITDGPCKCPNCGARYSTAIIKCDYCGLGPSTMRRTY